MIKRNIIVIGCTLKELLQLLLLLLLPNSYYYNLL